MNNNYLKLIFLSCCLVNNFTKAGFFDAIKAKFGFASQPTPLKVQEEPLLSSRVKDSSSIENKKAQESLSEVISKAIFEDLSTVKRIAAISNSLPKNALFERVKQLRSKFKIISQKLSQLYLKHESSSELKLLCDKFMKIEDRLTRHLKENDFRKRVLAALFLEISNDFESIIQISREIGFDDVFINHLLDTRVVFASAKSNLLEKRNHPNQSMRKKVLPKKKKERKPGFQKTTDSKYKPKKDSHKKRKKDLSQDE